MTAATDERHIIVRAIAIDGDDPFKDYGWETVSTCDLGEWPRWHFSQRDDEAGAQQEAILWWRDGCPCKRGAEYTEPCRRYVTDIVRRSGIGG